jgi:dihydrofolate reductase
MGKVITHFTMSLDGFIADPNDDVRRLFRWYNMGDTDLPVAFGSVVFKVSRASAELLQDAWGKLGAIVTGRRDFDISRAWDGSSPFENAPVVIVTHNPPAEWLKPDSPFTFVTDGVESAVAQAKGIAGDKDIAIGGTKVTQQALQAGLIDEIHLDLAHMLLGDGIRLFEHLETMPLDLENIRTIEAPGVTHLRFRIVK